jgi:NADH-quinone oxidoreductase subunit H
MFLGGWSIGVPFELTKVFGETLGMGAIGVVIGNVINVLVFITKGWFLVFVMMWVRWTLPRLRIDQVMMLCLKYLIPISCGLLLGVSAWTMLIPGMVQRFIGYGICGACVLAGVWLLYQLVTLAKMPPGTGMPGMWRVVGLPGYQGASKPS